jgi:hypothetical protein
MTLWVGQMQRQASHQVQYFGQFLSFAFLKKMVQSKQTLTLDYSPTDIYNTIRFGICIPRDTVLFCNPQLDSRVPNVHTQNHRLSTRTEAIAAQCAIQPLPSPHHHR